MTHSFHFAGRFLVALLLIATGVSSFGCGDSATVTESAALGNLSVSSGTLDPAFDPAITSYTVQLPIDISSTTITVSPRVAGDSIRIDNQQTTSQNITLNSPGAEQTITIVVTDTGTGGTSKSYNVKFQRATPNGNNSLASLEFSPGTLAEPFRADLTRYTASVANNIGSATVTPTLSDPLATMTVDGQPAVSGQARTISLNGGGQITTITITVTAQNGTPKPYEIRVSRGASNNNNLQSLTISPGKLSSFKASTTSYDVTVLSGVEKVAVTAAPRDTTASITYFADGVATSPQSITLRSPGLPTKITVRVTAQNGESKDYDINVKRAALNGNNKLNSLTVSQGNLSPDFDPDDETYEVGVSSAVTSVTITATPQDGTASLTINGQPSPTSINLGVPGPRTQISIPIVVRAQNNETRDYTVTIIRAALGGNKNLSALTVSPGSLDFSANTLTYTVNVGSNVPSVDVSARKADRNATMSQDVTAPPGTATGQATIQLGGPASTTPVLITVQAPNGDSQTYRINVVKDALGGNNNLSALTISPGSLNFNATTLTYTVNVGSNVPSVDVSARKADRNATMSQDVTAPPGTATGQATIQLGGPASTTPVLITVTAPNGSSQTYRINVVKDALGGNNNLSALTISPGSLNFNATTLTYTVNVGSTVPSVTVTATKADPASVISGNLPDSGQATIPLDGAPSSKDIRITVTAPNGDSKTYTITVNREAPSAPPTPSVAPDLIETDDSCEPDDTIGGDPTKCSLGTSKDDNVTNITTPRFTIPQPGSGETAILYINGSKDESSSTTENILRPSTPLADGTYTITYTLTNAGGESGESPPLDSPRLLQIDTTSLPPP